jgi:quinoprotein glucose dehydrogenase
MCSRFRRLSAWFVVAVVVGVGVTASSNQLLQVAAKVKAYTTWTEYEGGPDSAQYSALTQINKSNVSQLQQVWFYSAGTTNRRFGFNPIIVDNVMYVIGKNNSVAALDAATGKEVWVHDNGKPRSITSRGFNYWESKDRSERRLFFATENILHAIDARTGNLIDSFGDHGSVDLREGLGRDPKTIRQIQSGTPGRVFENLLILGSSTGEDYGSPPGDIRAYDVRTGKMAWIFHTVPHPGEYGYDTWPKDAYKYVGGTNDWGGMTIDEKRGIAYFPLGSGTYDFYGADRTGTNLFANCLLALDARTGKYLWHYQVVHHDLWDYDLTTSPKLLTIKHDGKSVDVVAQAGKTGFMYVFNRVTGKPIWPINEQPVPPSDMPGEHAWPTQPVPTAPPPFARQKYTADDVNPYIEDPKERQAIHDEIQNSHNGLFVPPGLVNTLEPAGNSGGSNWGAAAVDPTAGYFYVRSKDEPTMLKLEQKPPKFLFGSPATQGRILYIQNCQTCHTAELTGQPPAVPSLVDIVKRVGADRIRYAVTNGLPPMPAFTDLTDKNIDSLIAYLSAPTTAQIPPDLLAYITAPPPAKSATPDSVRYWSGYGYMMASDGLPQITPPWSTITAYDLNDGTLKWQVPAGGVSKLEEKGIKNTGSIEPRGGIAVTAGGLIFSGTSSDSTMRAYDKDTGKVLWETKLPAGPDGIPAVYEVGGRQYVVQSAVPTAVVSDMAAPAYQLPDTQGYYVFALPQTEVSSSSH